MLKNTLFFNKHILISIVITTAIMFSMYSINMALFIGSPIWGKGLFIPFAAGVAMGYLFGYLFNQRRKKQKALLATLEQQSILKEISLLSYHNYRLEEILDRSIHLILSASFAKLQSKGGISLSTINNRLELKSSLNLSPQILNSCGKAGVEFGECLCGLAAKEKKTIFKHCVDQAHSVTYEGMANHGHYNVPILHKNKVLGVIVVYLNAGHKNNPTEIGFLEGVANVLSLIISSYYSSQKALKKESTLREIQKFAGIGSWSKNISTKTITGSSEFYRLIGYEPNEVQLTEKFFQDITHPADVERLKKGISNAKKGIPYELEIRYFKKNGDLIHSINKCIPKVLENGEVEEISGIIIDVSELRKNKAELLEKQQLIEGILKASPDPLYLLDLETNEFVYYNKAMEDVIKNNPVFIIDYPKKGALLFREHVHPDDLEAYDKMNQALRKSDDIYTLRFRTYIFGDKYHWIEQKSLVYHRRKNGRVHQVLLLSKDISEKVHASNRVKKLNNDLVQQNRAIKKVNRELDQFVYSVSHDLRAPLASVLGLVNLGRLNPNLEELKEYVERIGVSIEKLDGFIKDILDYSRNARTDVEKQLVNLRSLFIGIIERIKPINNSDIEIDFKIDDDVFFHGDERRVSIILNNLVSNAIKYVDYSKPKRFLKVHISTSKNGCKFYFEDNGIGIDKKYQNDVFKMFFRATELSEGSGLGLYIVKEAIKKLHGTIDINSELGVGTSIIIQLPNKTARTNKV